MTALVDDYKRLHDSLLLSVHVDWASARLCVEIESEEGVRHTLTAEHLIAVVIPHEEPWGPSDWINRTDGPTPDRGGYRLGIQMQSGDVIEIVAGTFELPTW